MHLFIDDSGDPGTKFGLGSTQHLVIAACVFKDPEHMEAVATSIKNCSTLHRQQREFKFSKTKDSIKGKFFDCIAPHSFNVRAIVIDKNKIHSDHLIENANDLKAYAIRQLLTHTWGTVQKAKVVIDGMDTKSFQMADRDYFTRMVNRECPNTISEIKFADSKDNVLVQLADMVAGAVHRHVRTDEKQNSQHFESFKRRTWQPGGSLWHFR